VKRARSPPGCWRGKSRHRAHARTGVIGRLGSTLPLCAPGSRLLLHEIAETDQVVDREREGEHPPDARPPASPGLGPASDAASLRMLFDPRSMHDARRAKTKTAPARDQVGAWALQLERRAAIIGPPSSWRTIWRASPGPGGRPATPIAPATPPPSACHRLAAAAPRNPIEAASPLAPTCGFHRGPEPERLHTGAGDTIAVGALSSLVLPRFPGEQEGRIAMDRGVQRQPARCSRSPEYARRSCHLATTLQTSATPPAATSM
jgi:hypothetical protein